MPRPGGASRPIWSHLILGLGIVGRVSNYTTTTWQCCVAMKFGGQSVHDVAVDPVTLRTMINATYTDQNMLF